MQQSSLLSFFSRTPKQKREGNEPASLKEIATPESSSPSRSNGHTNGYQTPRSEEAKKVKETVTTPTSRSNSKKRRPSEPLNSEKKRRRVRVIESESDSDSDDDEDYEEDEEDEDDENEVESNRFKRFKCEPSSATKGKTGGSRSATTTPKGRQSGSSNARTPKSVNSLKLSTPGKGGPASEAPEEGQWTHLKLSWLKPNNIMDANRRRPDHPDYDPRTLYIPKDYLNSLTPGMRQWWELKAKNFDTILFFKVGKFYEFYHMDAVIATQELGITFMKGDYAHCGHPEVSYSHFASVLVEKGYKVARIEQTETPEMMAERCKKIKPTKFDKVVRREICQISTKGVRYPSIQDINRTTQFNPESSYLYAITEKPLVGDEVEYGVCFLDSTIGTIHVGQFIDDRYSSRLRTLLSHYVPAQILLEKGKVRGSTLQVISNLNDVRKDYLAPGSEFWSADKALKFIQEEKIFWNKSSDSMDWPESFSKLLCPDDSLGLTAAEGWELGVKGFGGLLWYLHHCLLEHDILSMKSFQLYKPIDDISENSNAQLAVPKHMVLDSSTLRNLDITDGTHSLLSVIDRCETHFGKRLLRQWICTPLANPEDIKRRQSAVFEMMSLHELTAKITPMLKSLPDLERLLLKVHYIGSAHRWKDHPDGRAVFFDSIKYSKHKIIDLLNVLKGFKTCVNIVKQFNDSKEDMYVISSELLKDILCGFPQLDGLLKFFDDAFDHQSAAKEGKIIPKRGVVQEYDNAADAVEEIQSEAQAYLKAIKKQLRAEVKFFGSDKNRFQLEVPESVRVSDEFELSSNRKGFRRYHTVETKSILNRIMHAEVERETILKDLTRRVFAQFDEHYEKWEQAVKVIANLDAILSLAHYSNSQEDMCRPTVITSPRAFIYIEEGRHPCVASESFISNDSKIGSKDPTEDPGTFLLLTGPNMGGKSTLMRQVGLITVLAHMGSLVPASKCEMSLVDRIFTRLGANDNIGEGESTFFVEMSETSSILKHSTPNSLVLMDELGRGTATYDGTGIAYAVARELSSRACRTLFSTHYHTLVKCLKDTPAVQLGHMACIVDNENEDDPTQETITFLYKLSSGPCPKSYGFNAARLAGIPLDVIRVAHEKAKQMEASVSKIDKFKEFVSKIKDRSFGLSDCASLAV